MWPYDMFKMAAGTVIFLSLVDDALTESCADNSLFPCVIMAAEQSQPFD